MAEVGFGEKSDPIYNSIEIKDTYTSFLREEMRAEARSIKPVGTVSDWLISYAPDNGGYRYGIPHPNSTVNLLVQRKRVPDLHSGH